MEARDPSADVCETFVSEIASPCTNVCTIDPATGWCAGCLRTIDEITAWRGLDDAARAAVWKQLPLRRAELDHAAADAAAPAAFRNDAP